MVIYIIVAYVSHAYKYYIDLIVSTENGVFILAIIITNTFGFRTPIKCCCKCINKWINICARNIF